MKVRGSLAPPLVGGTNANRGERSASSMTFPQEGIRDK
jgi:hypothetical protein